MERTEWGRGGSNKAVTGEGEGQIYSGSGVNLATEVATKS